MENENILKVKTEEGQEIEINVIDIIKIEELNKEYIVYTLVSEASESQNIYIAILDEKETEYSIKYIEDEQEWETVNSIVNEMIPNEEE